VAYEEYCKAVPRWIPRVIRVKREGKREVSFFEWKATGYGMAEKQGINKKSRLVSGNLNFE
jgi:hypothetical protein